jgi:hypothetical protein
VFAPGQSALLPIDIVFALNGTVQVVNAEVSGGGEVRLDNNRATTAAEINPRVIPVLSAINMMLLMLLLITVATRRIGRRAMVMRRIG